MAETTTLRDRREAMSECIRTILNEHVTVPDKEGWIRTTEYRLALAVQEIAAALSTSEPEDGR